MDNLVNVLKQLPEVELRLIDLAWQVAKDDGSIDMEQVLQKAKEVDDAVAEAKAYADSTRKAVSCLMRLVPS